MEKIEDIKTRIKKIDYGISFVTAGTSDSVSDFILHAPEDIRFLLDMIEKQRKEIEEFKPIVNIPDVNRTRVR